LGLRSDMMIEQDEDSHKYAGLSRLL
jgi:hypothetical protein